jgi:hypothetical protein
MSQMRKQNCNGSCIFGGCVCGNGKYSKTKTLIFNARVFALL